MAATLPDGNSGSKEEHFPEDETDEVFVPMRDGLDVRHNALRAFLEARTAKHMIAIGVALTVVLIAMVLAILLSGCRSLPTQAHPPTALELEAIRASVAGWESTGLNPIGDLCLEHLPRVHVIVAEDTEPWCHQPGARACLAAGYTGPVWAHDYHPLLVRDLEADPWGAVVHEMLHVLGRCTLSGRDDFHQLEELWGPDGLNRRLRESSPPTPRD